MSRNIRNLRRPPGKRQYWKLFVIRAEGDKTEPQYFKALNRLVSDSYVKCLRSKHASSPPQALRHMQDYLKEESPADPYEAWLVIDRDQWGKAQLALLNEWEQQESNYGLAISNPKFEHWLLSHFEDGKNVGSAQECSRRLRQFLPDYDKNIDIPRITRNRIDDAIRRAKARYAPTPESEPLPFGCTTVYKLVEKILHPD